MTLEKKTRLFLFGCPRSGTTLLQSLLAAHPQILSVPETQFFWYMIPIYKERWRQFIQWRQWLKVPRKGFKAELKNFFENDINRADLLQKFSGFTFFRSQYTEKFIAILDALAESEGKKIWLEKSPEHIYHVDYIEKFVPEAKFIHILRNGEDVVASLYDVTRKHPKSWGGKKWSLNFCIKRWLEAVEISRENLNKPNHIFVRYEDLVENPQAELVRLCEFIGIEFTDSMLQNYGSAAEKLTLESGGRTVAREITNRNSQKFQKLFKESEKEYILQQLSQVNLDWAKKNN